MVETFGPSSEQKNLLFEFSFRGEFSGSGLPSWVSRSNQAFPSAAGRFAQTSGVGGGRQGEGSGGDRSEPLCWQDGDMRVPAGVCAQVTLNDPHTEGEMGKKTLGILYRIGFC